MVVRMLWICGLVLWASLVAVRVVEDVPQRLQQLLAYGALPWFLMELARGQAEMEAAGRAALFASDLQAAVPWYEGGPVNPRLAIRAAVAR